MTTRNVDKSTLSATWTTRKTISTVDNKKNYQHSVGSKDDNKQTTSNMDKRAKTIRTIVDNKDDKKKPPVLWTSEKDQHDCGQQR